MIFHDAVVSSWHGDSVIYEDFGSHYPFPFFVGDAFALTNSCGSRGRIWVLVSHLCGLSFRGGGDISFNVYEGETL